MLKIKRSILIMLIIVLLLSFVSVSADSTSGSSGSSGWGSSSGGYSTPSYTENVSMSEFTAKGTIYLPDGFVAPAGGLKIYGGFGGATFQNIMLAGDLSYGLEETVLDTETIEYEKIDIIATVPQGENCVTFEKTFSVTSAADAFYGEFWVYDTEILSNDGEKYLSNKICVSNITKIKANKNEYSNINTTLSFAENKVDYKVTFADELLYEKPSQTIFVIADDGYDRYITKSDIVSCDKSISGTIKTENEEYELKYYIPSTNLLENQKIATGLYDCGTADFDTVNTVTVNAQTYIAGVVTRPNNDNSIEELKLKLSTSEAEVNVTIPQNGSSCEYVIGVNNSSREYIKIEILNSDYYKSGYYDGESFYDYKEYYGYICESIDDLTIELQRQCVIKGKINLPEAVTMPEKTWFTVYMEIGNENGTYSDSGCFVKFSDKECEYKFFVPYEYKNDRFSIRYWYENSITYDTSFPTEAKSPLPYYYGYVDGGTRPGGGGSSSGEIGIVGYTKEMPIGLLNKRMIFTNMNAGTFDKSDASLYSFSSGSISADIILAKSGSIPNETAIGGYFTNLLSADGNVTVQLLDKTTKLPKYSQNVSNGKYIFYDMEYNKYIISVLYNDKKYYYTGKILSEDFEEAKIIDVDETPVSYGNDIYYENVFSANIESRIEECTINGNSENVTIGIYDINGQLRAEYGAEETVKISFSPFILSIDNNYVSEYTTDSNIQVKGVTNNFKKAQVFEVQYYNTINRLTASTGNGIAVNVSLPDYSISNVRFKDKYVEADIKKNVENEEAADIYYAVYYKKRLIDLTSDKLDIGKGTKTVKSVRPLNADDSSDITIRVFIWSKDMIPVAEYGETEL